MSDRILISFGRPRMGELLLRLAHLLRPTAELQAIHFSPDPTVPREEAAYNTAESFDRLKSVADELQTRVRFVYREAANITDAIVRHTEAFNPDYLFLGAAGLFAADEPLGGRVGEVLSRIRCPAGVVLDRGLDRFEQFVILRDPKNGHRVSELFGEAPERARIEVVDRFDHASLVDADRVVAVLTALQLTLLPERGSAMILCFKDD
ncbi:MAG: hypothetical protein CVV45_00525 [Spirochaetae bacterium HGW-Spirochaetae-10]|nr:MAG: hypothetical protein CVV45_00525 [Spirochaetae bacterium HGW-Spirochaetae-10]